MAKTSPQANQKAQAKLDVAKLLHQPKDTSGYWLAKWHQWHQHRLKIKGNK